MAPDWKKKKLTHLTALGKQTLICMKSEAPITTSVPTKATVGESRAVIQPPSLSLSLCVCVWPNGCWWPNMCSSDRTAEQTGDGSCANGRLSRLRCHDHICAPPGYQALLIITRGTFSEIGPPFISRECRIEELARGDNDFKLPFRQLIPRSGVKQKSAVRCVYVDTIWNHNSGLKVHYSAQEPEQDVSVRESNNIVRVMTTNYWFLFGLRLRKQQKADIDM